ncbi:hypothetical protein CWE04_11480 [Thomasclavelia cocleata]|uniref:Uncharacterized protein n=1 Tax=Thomasclavelia cocleata TaxID=69824 RepID=A0A1I0GCD3_9FIRM|nr:hypothetical protein [Thomasclavelia cocleata]MCR1959852.1 hypothetical protein [Thomasclavelia cocleata]NDO43202.1 hypothetical protein [Thomasclavelia cocleata]PJN79825.1 hypothetical protein CWE04_11480 [Thomasclavelia cocleata]SET68658.1 hypothetical protein SAMN04489758_12828 [Thomasclavelia cocleata]
MKFDKEKKDHITVYDGQTKIFSFNLRKDIPKVNTISEPLFKPGDRVKTKHGIGEVMNIWGLNERMIYKYDVLIIENNFCRFWRLCFEEDQLEIYSNKEGEMKNMENNELKRIRDLALNIIRNVKNYKITSARDEYSKKIEELTKQIEVNKLAKKHAELLQKDIQNLLGRDCSNDSSNLLAYSNFLTTVNFLDSDGYLTTDEKNEKQKTVNDFKEERKQIVKKFDNIINSLYLCTTTDQINEFLDNQKFRVNGLIVSPEDWKG